jgi:hypothetical protein
VVYLPADLKALVAAQVERVQSLEQNLGRIIPHLFPHTRGPAPGGGFRIFAGRDRVPAVAQSGRGCATTPVAPPSGIWYTRMSLSAWPRR